MNDLAALLTAVTGLITAATTAFAVIRTAGNRSRSERKTSAQRAVERLIAAAEDGDITADELAEAAKELEGSEDE